MIERMSVMNRNRKLNRISKTVISGLLVTSLVVSNGAYANAQKISKDESVYVNADESGATTKITVSNWLKNAGINGTINDESDLKDIQNVKGDETFTQNADDVQWSAGSNDIYYQGTTDKELPVGVEIKYELDGKEIAAKDLLGQSGKLKITVSYTNKSKSTQTINGEKQEMYTPFVMATGIILPDDKFSNVEVDDGKIINEGSNNIVVGFGRVDGETIGFVANQPLVLAGVLDCDSADKAGRFIRFCDAFNIPIVTFEDMPGYLPGVEQEYMGVIRHGAKVLYAYSEATVPKVTVILRKAYGGGYIAMNSRHLKADFMFAWPTAEIAVMGPEGAANIIFRKEIKESANPEETRKQKVAEYREKFANPYVAASKGYIDSVIEPSETRLLLKHSIEVSGNKTVMTPAKKHGIPPF